MMGFVNVCVLLLALATAVSGLQCSAQNKLALEYLNKTIYPQGQCSDGSDPGFYVGVTDPDEVDVFRPFIIWLGDTQICSDETCDDICDGTGRDGGEGVCDGVLSTDNLFGVNSDLDAQDQDLDTDRGRCLYSRIVCTSSWWNDFEEVTPGSVLCQDQPFYGEYTRVFLPSCTLDYWLGTGDVNNATSPRHKGAVNFDAIIRTLIDKYGLGKSNQIILGGTRGAGIGAMHLLSRMKAILEFNDNPMTGVVDPTENATVDRKILGVVDSSWLLNFEEFAPSQEERDSDLGVFAVDNYLRINSSAWINNSDILQSCKDKWLPLDKVYKCLYPSELVMNHLNDGVNVKFPLFFIQSQYDVVQLFDLGLNDNDASDQFGDDLSFAQGSTSYVENYGQEVRISLQEASQSSVQSGEDFFFYTTVCAQHGYIVPTQIHTIDPRIEEVGDVGSVRFQRDEEVWENINTEEVVLFTALQTFIISNGTEMIENFPDRRFLGDTCGRFLCNAECPTDLIPFAVTFTFGDCLREIMVVYAIWTLFIFVAPFILAWRQSVAWRKTTTIFWKRVDLLQNLEQMQHDQEFQEIFKDQLKSGGALAMKKIQFDQRRTAEEVERQLILESNTGEYREVHLMVEDLHYWASPRTRRQKPFKVLDGVSVGYQPSQVHALMGPSGSGKSTLLDILSLTRESGQMAGVHSINGIPSNDKNAKFIKEWFVHNSSYVAQTDVLFPQLTVREHMEHAAWLMLPEYMLDDAKLRRVWQFMRLLDLTESANTLCGDGGVTVKGGLSGGQRRRVSVATALLRNPSVLFLDEPTSGLDSYSALNLVERLRKLAQGTSVNVIMTIHQPRKEIFRFIDTITILVNGKVCFFGDKQDSVKFFRLDPIKANIGNDIIDLLTDITPDALAGFVRQFEESNNYQKLRDSMEKEKTDFTPEVAQQLREVLVFNSLAEGRWSWTSAGSVTWLQWVLLSRTIRRGGFDLLLTTIYSLIGGLFLGSIFLGRNSYTSRVALLYLTVACITFFQGIFLANRYFDEKKMWDHEKRSGTMKSSAAFIASQFTRDATTACVETIVFIIPLLAFGSLSLELGRLSLFVLVCLLVAYTTTCLNVLIETLIDNVEKASIAQVFVLGIGALFNGFIINLSDIPIWLSWLPYLMLSFWGFVGALVNELTDFQLPCDEEKFSPLECAVRTGDIILRTLDYDAYDVFLCMAVLILMIFIFRLTAYAVFYKRFGRTFVMKRVTVEGKGGKRTLLNGFSSRSLNTSGGIGESTTSLGQQGSTVRGLIQKGLTRQPSDGKIQRKEENLVIAPQTFDIETQEEDDLADDQSEYDDDVGFGKPSLINFLLLSREALTTLYLIDVYSIWYICAFTDDTAAIFWGISGLFFVLYVTQFAYQIWALIPYTVDGADRDFVWASEYDFPALVTVIVDSAMFVLQFTIADSFEIRGILQLALHVIRGFRVVLYWLKVNKQHSNTANSFLQFKQAEMDAIIAEELKDGGGAPGGNARLSARISKRYGQNRGGGPSGRFSAVGRFSQKYNRERLAQALGAATRKNEGLTSPSGAPPPRPPRPNARNLEARSGPAPRRPARPNEAPGRSHGSQGSGGPGSRFGALSSRLGPRRPNRPTNNSNRLTRAAESGQGAGWKKFKNPKTGKTIYYNPFTGEVLEGVIPQMGANTGAAPTLDEV